MAKGDHDRAEAALATQGPIMQTTQDSTRSSLEGTRNTMYNNYNIGQAANQGTYNDVMGKYNELYANPFGEGGLSGIGGNGYGGGYQSSTQGIYSDLANNGGGYGWDPMFRGAMGNAISGYGEFANNGGFSDQAIADMRERNLRPTKQVFQTAQNELNRSRSLSGGSANYAAAQGKLARDLAYNIGDMNVDTNAALAQMIQQGKLAGLQGLSSTGAAGQGLSTNIDELNARMKLAGLSGLDSIDARNAAAGAAASANADANAKALFNARMGVLGGMTDMYGTNPALLNVTGNQLLGADQNLLNAQQLQNGLGMGMIDRTQNLSQIPGNFQSAMNNVGSVIGAVAPIAGAFTGGFGNLGGSNVSQRQLPVTTDFGAAQQLGNPVSLGGFGSIQGGALTAPNSNDIMMMPQNGTFTNNLSNWNGVPNYGTGMDLRQVDQRYV